MLFGQTLKRALLLSGELLMCCEPREGNKNTFREVCGNFCKGKKFRNNFAVLPRAVTYPEVICDGLLMTNTNKSAKLEAIFFGKSADVVHNFRS